MTGLGGLSTPLHSLFGLLSPGAGWARCAGLSPHTDAVLLPVNNLNDFAAEV